jgi:hypothetical protein
MFWECKIFHLKVGGKWNTYTLNLPLYKLWHMFWFNWLGEKLKGKTWDFSIFIIGKYYVK